MHWRKCIIVWVFFIRFIKCAIRKMNISLKVANSTILKTNGDQISMFWKANMFFLEFNIFLTLKTLYSQPLYSTVLSKFSSECLCELCKFVFKFFTWCRLTRNAHRKFFDDPFLNWNRNFCSTMQYGQDSSKRVNE